MMNPEDPRIDEEEPRVERGGIKAQPVDNTGELPVIRWLNRRMMAWWAIRALLIYTLIYWFGLPLWFQWWNIPTTWLEIIGESFFWFAATMSAVILGYMGFTSLPFLGKGQRSNQNSEDSYSHRRNDKYIIEDD